jgi:hypothetical protein
MCMHASTTLIHTTTNDIEERQQWQHTEQTLTVRTSDRTPCRSIDPLVALHKAPLLTQEH